MTSDAISTALQDAFRRESSRVVASLMSVVRDLSVAEEILQETLITAMERWPAHGVPSNPGAWLTTVARNKALDYVRHQKISRVKKNLIANELADQHVEPASAMDPETILDEQLRLIFICCHPALTQESRVALTLRMVGGLTTPEIARAFLTSEPTIAQRIVRAKNTIRDQRLPYEVPVANELPERLSSVLAVLYLIFNESYSARQGSELVRVDLSAEAIRLATLLCELMPHEAEALGLLALMELHAARHRARTDASGNMVLLADQDRSVWDKALIARGVAHLERAGAMNAQGPYQLQAAIAACHATAAQWTQTPWPQISTLYERLFELTQSPVVALNHAVAIGMVAGPEAGLALVNQLDQSLGDYHLLHATRADFLRQLQRWPEAIAEYERAIALSQNESERAFLARRIAQCRQ